MIVERTFGVAALLLVLASSCATTPPPAAPAPSPWVSPLHRDHPLVGKAWDVAAQRFVSWDEVKARAQGTRFVVLGETHDNPDHHLLQAEVVRHVAAFGRKPAVAFEMLDVARQEEVDAALATDPRDSDALASAVDWAHSGWPDFAMYRPIFEAALEARLPIVAANLSRADARRLIKEGRDALEPSLRERLAQDEPLPAPLAAALREEMITSHCGALPEPMIDPMVLAQRARDVRLAQRLEHGDRGQGALLITGAGHARRDRGVPRVLTRDLPDAAVLSVAFLEARPGDTSPESYAGAFGTHVLPFDVVVFTPATSREDPCAKFRAR